MTISFEVPVIPRAQGRPRFARMGKFVRTYKDKRTEEAEQTFIALALPHAPAAPFEGPVFVSFEFVFTPPKSWPKWKQQVIGTVKHVSRPDVDNLQKLALDAMTRCGRFWRDDAQICQVAARKRYAASPRTCVYVFEEYQPSAPKKGAQEGAAA